MAEAEEVVTDVARHATIFARGLWRRYRTNDDFDRSPVLADVAQRMSLLVFSVFGVWYDIRTAQSPAPRTLLRSVFGGQRGPERSDAVPATDDASLWLPGTVGCEDPNLAIQIFRSMALQQAMRAQRCSAAGLTQDMSGLTGDLYLLLEAVSADEDLANLLPGTARSTNILRREALSRRPAPERFPVHARSLENLARELMQSDCGAPICRQHYSRTPEESQRAARAMVLEFARPDTSARKAADGTLLKDHWTGDLISPAPVSQRFDVDDDAGKEPDDSRAASSRLARRPEVRERKEDENDERDAGIWMVQADEPHEKAEDPMGIQRPTDQDDCRDTEQLGDMLSELPEASLVRSPGRSKEVLLSDDPPPRTATGTAHSAAVDNSPFTYPEWDYRRSAYRHPGATVRVLPPETGALTWVERTVTEHRSMLQLITRRFEMLKARPKILKRQVDGEEIDLDACIDAFADLRAGTRLPEALYERRHAGERDLAILLLIDVSGSTDGWLSKNRRIIDVEREALLLVCIALRAMGEPYAVRTFSGEGPDCVTVRPIKEFNEDFDDETALRIAALEPEHYTRAGSAVRHVTSELLQQTAGDRLLLLLSDGKPNDVDLYEGRYGVEDTRQAVAEARMQGIHPFCLTIDRQATNYLPRIFGENQYAMLPKPELLPSVLLDWMRRLIATRGNQT